MFRNDSRHRQERSRGFTRPMTDTEADDCIAKWVAILAIGHAIRHERISIWQVTGESGRPGCSLVGVYDDNTETEGGACVLHTRRLTEEDIVHELLHVANPTWSEGQVVGETTRLAAIGQSSPLPDRGVPQRAPTARRTRQSVARAAQESCLPKGMN